MDAELDRIRSVLEGYEILDELGRGGWGVVLGGRHRRLGRDVAIKQLPAVFAADPSVRSRFVTESRLLASLDHPHIVPVYDFVEVDDCCLLVMEKLAGGTVWDRFTGTGLTAEAACAVTLATAAALHHAHERGILHRDVKPENLLFATTGAVKVSDFGIARVLGGGHTVGTRDGDILGTPAYMSPEQASGEDLGPPTDVYSLAVVVYELLSGELPFPVRGDESPLVLLFRHVNDDPVPLRSVAPTVPAPIEDVVMQGLAKPVSARHPTAEAFGVALAGAAAEAFGAGWLERAEVPLMAGAPLLAAASAAAPARRPAPGTIRRPAPGPAAAPATPAGTTSAATRPARRPPATVATELEPRDLVPVPELARREHENREVELLGQIRDGRAPLRSGDLEQAERLLGGHGATATARCGLPADATAAEVREAAAAALAHWQRRAENPLSTRQQADAARLLIRTCEGLLASLG